MSALEKSVKRLAVALDALESKLDDRLADPGGGERAARARMKAETAKTQAAAASEDLADAIGELKTLIAKGRKG